ncbi:MAG TPA: hypothetical protein VGL77_00930 [Armatimonadota bacterium]|jgi:hypothetical protein
MSDRLSATAHTDGTLPFTLRAGVSTHLVYGFLLGWCLPLCYILARTNHQAIWELGVVFALDCVAFLLGIRACTVRLDDEAISYRTFVGGTQRIRFADVESASIQRSRSWTDPTYALQIIPCPATGKRPLRINLRVFGVKDLQRFLALLVAHGVLRSPRPRAGKAD